MVILGIDPGTAVTGYGVVRTVNNAMSWMDAGVIVTDTSMPLCRRLLLIYDGIREKIAEYNPQRVSVEEAFYGKNVHTTLVLGHARGVAMLAAAQHGCEVSEYSPREIKKSVTGNGNATKEQVEYMVKMLLRSPVEKMRQDAYDALAVAVCDFYNMGRAALINKK
ncbi:MAG: crossover junction endodeoxyribonuclease RuvC [Chitinispirillales bacterium]|jgi:crossover junction endodeoxyribonuclease RuvC|nr:crossover junction endodeoxyribonuclease RuvC [Chitinispirillales bacterium]